MKKTIYFTIVVFILTMFSLQSCKKENQESKNVASNNQNSSNYQVQNGRLVFNTAAAIDSIVPKLNSLKTSDFNSWENSLHFSSYRTYTHNIDMQNWTTYCINHDTVSPAIEYQKLSDIYDCVLNLKGEVQTKDTVYYFHGSKIYAIPYDGETNLQSKEVLVNQSSSSLIENVRSFTLKVDTLKANTAINVKLKGRAFNTAYTSGFTWPNSNTNYNFFFIAQVSGAGLSNYGYSTIYLKNYLEYWNSRWNGGSWNLSGVVCTKCDNVQMYLSGSPILNTLLPPYYPIVYVEDNEYYTQQVTVKGKIQQNTLFVEGYMYIEIPAYPGISFAIESNPDPDAYYTGTDLWHY